MVRKTALKLFPTARKLIGSFSLLQGDRLIEAAAAAAAVAAAAAAVASATTGELLCQRAFCFVVLEFVCLTCSGCGRQCGMCSFQSPSVEYRACSVTSMEETDQNQCFAARTEGAGGKGQVLAGLLLTGDPQSRARNSKMG